MDVALPVRNGKEHSHDQGRHQLQVVGVQAQLQNDLQNDVVDHSADGHAQQLQGEVAEQLAEGHLADDDGGKANQAVGVDKYDLLVSQRYVRTVSLDNPLPLLVVFAVLGALLPLLVPVALVAAAYGILKNYA